jgi:hypothetical protein
VCVVTMAPEGIVTICFSDSMNPITGCRRRYRVTMLTLRQADGSCSNVLRPHREVLVFDASILPSRRGSGSGACYRSATSVPRAYATVEESSFVRS